jgi:AcrR family transcriptional regulator
MTPRAYRMGKRAGLVEDTRKRIVEATLRLHTTKGFQATSWQDIAELADVSVGTVYYHFPSFDELIPACSSLGLSKSRPPTTEIFRGLRSRRARVDRLVADLFDYYERAQMGMRNVLREKDSIPAVGRFAAEAQRRVRDLIGAAVGADATKVDLDIAEALLDFRVWESLTQRGIGKEAAARLMVHLLDCSRARS